MADNSPIELAEPETLSVEEAGRVLGIGRNAAYEACRRGDIPTLRVGKRILVPRRRLLELLSASPNTHEPGSFPGSKGSCDDRRGSG